MEVFSVEEFQERWDELISRVENGETLGITNESGNTAVMVPIDDESYQLYVDHDEAS
jgi:antitoxin (DNA-binding transcriptional repressor) of toxin-antitoxin stability system